MQTLLIFTRFSDKKIYPKDHNQKWVLLVIGEENIRIYHMYNQNTN